MDKIISPEDAQIKYYLKPLFVNLLSVYARRGKTTLDLHLDLSSLLAIRTEIKKLNSYNHASAKENSKIKKRILIVSNMFPSFLHGGGLRIFDIISALHNDFEITLYSTYVDDIDSESYKYLKDKLNDCHLTTMADFSKESFKKWIEFKNFSVNHFDVVHLEYHASLNFLDEVKKVGKRIIFTVMESLALSNYIEFVSTIDLTKKSFSDNLDKFLTFALYEKYALDNCDEVIAVTDHDADFIARFSSRRPKVINHCVSDYAILSRLALAEFTPIENSVCFVANFQHPPNIDGMLWYIHNVHPEIKKKIPDYKVIIVGLGNTERLKKVTRNDDHFIFTGYLEDIVPTILSSTVCISPLISGAGLRGKVNQYSACGKASVNTSISLRGLPYVPMKDTVLADDPDEFSNAVIMLLTDKNFRSKIEENSLAVVKKHFSWESKIKELVQLY